MEMQSFNETIIQEFRENGGKVKQFGGLPLIILHTIGAKSGEVKLAPLVVIQSEGSLLIFGSYAGNKKHPAWVHNVRKQPDITVEYGTETLQATIAELAPVAAAEKVEEQRQRTTQFADYVANAAPRVIPVFRIEFT